MSDDGWVVKLSGRVVGALTAEQYRDLKASIGANKMIWPYQVAHSLYTGFRIFVESLPASGIYSILVIALYATINPEAVNDHLGGDLASLLSLIFKLTFAANAITTVAAMGIYRLRSLGFRNIREEQTHLAVLDHFGLMPEYCNDLSMVRASEIRSE